MKKYFVLSIVSLLSLLLPAQEYLPFKQVRSYTQVQKPNKLDSSLKYLTNRLGYEVHYLYPLYQAIGWEAKFKKLLGEKGYYENFSELVSFTGDYAMASALLEKSFARLSDSAILSIEAGVSQLKDIQSASARTAILSNAQYYRVIMLNENHTKSVHRAFTYSLLDSLYRLGYHYLAMEMLNNFSNQFLDSLNVFTGYYTNEPIAGELVRKALQIGYKLVSYEDTLIQQHTGSQRDSIQAANIYRVIEKDPTAKILVHSGHGHIKEEKISDYAPMGWWFKKISGLDPFTVDQTGMTEGSDFEFGKFYYKYFTDLFSINEPSVIFENRRPFNPLHEKGYDMIVVHPPTIYQNNRPSWISLNGERKPVLLQPTERNLFFVQAYYENEYDENMLPLMIPADQTYITNREGYYPLYLRKGKYKIVLRDITYKILSVKDREVN